MPSKSEPRATVSSPRRLDHVPEVADQIVGLAHRPGAQEAGVEVGPYQAAPVPQGPEHLVGEVPPVGPQGPGVGVAGQEGPPGSPAHVPEAPVGEVGDVREHPQGLHLRQEGEAGPGEAPGLAVGGAQLVGVVPGEGEDPHPQAVEGAQQGEGAPAYAPLLHGEQAADLAGLPGLDQVLEGQNRRARSRFCASSVQYRSARVRTSSKGSSGRAAMDWA